MITEAKVNSAKLTFKYGENDFETMTLNEFLDGKEVKITLEGTAYLADGSVGVRIKRPDSTGNDVLMEFNSLQVQLTDKELKDINENKVFPVYGDVHDLNLEQLIDLVMTDEDLSYELD